MQLRRGQEWLVSAITSADALDNVADIRDFVTPGPRMTAIERLGVYHHAYRARLVECLADDYPALEHALGDDVFERLCHGYMAAHPPISFSLNFFGAKLPAFCRMTGETWSTFGADLAELEWAIVKAIHAPDLRPIGPEELAKVGADEWGRVVLEPAAALTVLSTTYPANEYYGAFRADDDSARPPRSSIPAPRPSGIAVYRDATTVWRQDLSPEALNVLRALVTGSNLEKALSSADASEEQVTAWFQSWMRAGFFARLAVESSSGT